MSNKLKFADESNKVIFEDRSAKLKVSDDSEKLIFDITQVFDFLLIGIGENLLISVGDKLRI